MKSSSCRYNFLYLQLCKDKCEVKENDKQKTSPQWDNPVAGTTFCIYNFAKTNVKSKKTSYKWRLLNEITRLHVHTCLHIIQFCKDKDGENECYHLKYRLSSCTYPPFESSSEDFDPVAEKWHGGTKALFPFFFKDEQWSDCGRGFLEHIELRNTSEQGLNAPLQKELKSLKLNSGAPCSRKSTHSLVSKWISTGKKEIRDLSRVIWN